MPLVDVHNHIPSRQYADLLARFGGHRYSLARDAEGRTVVMRAGARLMTFTEPIFDPELRLRAMDEVGVVIELLSYTCSNAYWAEGTLAAEVARVMNDHLAELCARWPARFRSLASVPLQNIGDMAGCARRIDTLPIDEAEKELIRSGNARRVFKL